MSPSLASSATKAGSFASSPRWKRVFSSSTMSPSAISATAEDALSPMQSATNFIGLFKWPASAAPTGRSEFSLSGPFGRPKCESRMTLPPLSAISTIVGRMRSIRVPSAICPFSTGTLRSTRKSTRLPATCASSRVRKLFIFLSALVPHPPRVRRACPSRPPCPPCGSKSPIRYHTRRGCARTFHR